MNNWCNNELGIRGNEALLADFREKVKNEHEDFSLDSLCKMPEELEHRNPKKDSPNWYHWRLENWGTPFDVGWVLLSCATGGYLEYKFFSFHKPPIVWLEHVSQDYPKLEFGLAYGEDGLGFAGYVIIKNGQLEFR